MATTTEFDPKRFIADFERAFHTRDYQAVRKYYDPNVEFAIDAKGVTARGIDTFEQFWSTWAENFSEAKIEIVHAVVNGRDVAILQRCTGKHTGDGFEVQPGEKVPATQRPINITVAEFIKLDANGKIIRDDGLMDTGEMMRQLGVLPSSTQQDASRRAVSR